MTTSTESEKQVFQFQSEAKQVLDLMIHSVYSNKDIFLRELISNASDAIDKLKFESLTHHEFTEHTNNPEIRIEPNAADHTLTISDTGIGMSRDEVIQYIGTIAKSGSREFLKMMQEAKDKASSPELIGQFGVGFYSSFMVADRIALTTRRAGEARATRWESTGDGTYTLEEAEKPEVGTTITLHLKPVDSEDEMHDYTSEWTLRGIIKKYSDYVAYPIRLKVEKKKEELVEIDWETVNSMKAIWRRPKEEVSEEEYKEFYKHISHDWNEPAKTFTLRAEGTFEFTALLFLPSKAPFDLFHREAENGIALYVKRVFIMHDCKELMPEYLRYVKGVVDSEDLSLNISREILQQDRHIRLIRKRLVKKTLEVLKEMRDQDNEKYLNFWKEFGRAFKEGLLSDHENQVALLDLTLLASTDSPTDLTTLPKYVARMKEGQEKIYYITGESRSVIEKSPHLEAFRAKGYEVLLLTDPIDELWAQQVGEFEGKTFQSAGKGEVALGTEEEKKKAEEDLKEKQKDLKPLLEALQSKLADEVKEVRLSMRLTDSAACLVGEQFDVSPHLEKLMKAAGQELPKTKRILEVNPNHPIIAKLEGVREKDSADPLIADYAQLLYGQALLAEGAQLPDPGGFSKRIAELMVRAI